MPYIVVRKCTSSHTHHTFDYLVVLVAHGAVWSHVRSHHSGVATQRPLRSFPFAMIECRVRVFEFKHLSDSFSVRLQTSFVRSYEVLGL